MAQHDQVIDNASGLAVRTDINSALAALFSSSSGTVEPTVKNAGQFWFDTSASPGVIKIRNSANNAWITVGTLSAVDMGSGFRTSPDRWVVNENAALTGRDYLKVEDTTGILTMQDILNMVEVDGSIRGKIQVGIGADAGTMYHIVYDAAGTEVTRWTMNVSGLALKAGGFRFNNGAAVRGQMSAELAAGNVAGRLNLESYTQSSVLDGSAVITASGLALNLAGDFYISRAGVVRANYGWDATLGAYHRHRSAAGAIDGELDVAPAGASLLYGSYRLVTAASVLRGAMIAERVAAPGKINLESYTSAGVLDGQMALNAGGVSLFYGDYDISRAGVNRANFGWLAGDGTFIRHRDTGGTINGELDVRDTGASVLFGDFNVMRATVIRGVFGFGTATFIENRDAAGAVIGHLEIRSTKTVLATGNISTGGGGYYMEDAASIVRGKMDVNHNGNILSLVSQNQSGAVAAGLDIGPSGIFATTFAGASKQVFDTAWFPSQENTNGGLNFPVGHTVFVAVSNTNQVNRNQTAAVKLADASNASYSLVGTGSALAGTWRSCGLDQIAGAGSNWYGLFRRVS